MAHGQNASKHWGKEWWGKRPFSGISANGIKSMKSWKRLLHKAERNIGKRDLQYRLING